MLDDRTKLAIPSPTAREALRKLLVERDDELAGDTDAPRIFRLVETVRYWRLIWTILGRIDEA